ncbi:MAG: oligosaccharide flippase family protein, partial [Bacteroidota bacterium]
MKRPLVNLLSLLFGDLGSRFIGFLISVYLARILEPTGFGIMSLGLAVLGYLQLAGSPGIQVLETRNMAAVAEVDQKRVNAVISLRLVLAVILWIGTAVVVNLFTLPDTTRDVIILFTCTLFPFAVFLDWFFQGKEAFIAIGFSRLIQYVSYGVLVLLLVHTADDVRRTAVAFGVGAATSAIALWLLYASKWRTLRFSWAPTLWKEILTKSVPVGAAVFFAQSVTNLPPLVIGYFSTVGDVGMFSSAMKLVFLLMLVDRLFNALFLPVVTRYFSSRPEEEVKKLAEVMLRTLLVIIIPLTAGGVILGRQAVVFVFGEGYQDAAHLVQILMGYFAFTVLNSLFVCVLLGSGREKEYTKMLIWGSVVLCLAAIALTAVFGVAGAATAVVFGELVT